MEKKADNKRPDNKKICDKMGDLEHRNDKQINSEDGNKADCQKVAIGIDVGSVSTDFVTIDEDLNIREELYLKTRGNPIGAIREGMEKLSRIYCDDDIIAVGTTGSGRALAGTIVGADSVKNEITTHGVASATVNPEVSTIIEIGGQDSKLILLKDGLPVDFAMNTVCAAGTGSFLDRQAERLGLKVWELGAFALRSKSPVRIAGRCAVFAESDLIHKQQLGCSKEDIIAGMSMALVRNYLSNVAKGKKIVPPVMFQGGVAANTGIKAAFEEALGLPVEVPEYHKVMGAYGAAILALRHINSNNNPNIQKPFNSSDVSNIRKDSGQYGNKNNPNIQKPFNSSGNSNIGKDPGQYGNKNNLNAQRHQSTQIKQTAFKGFGNSVADVESRCFECHECPNHCEVVELFAGGRRIGAFSDRCGRYNASSDLVPNNGD